MTVLSNIITPSNVLTTTNTATVSNKTLTSPTVTGMVVSDGTANGVTYLNGSKVLTSGSALVFDGTNLGLGVTPSATNTSYKAQEIGFVGNGLIGFGANDFAMSSGAYYSSSGWKHSATNSLGASFYEQYTGQHIWYNKTAVSHTAGDAITFTQAMTLDASGNLGIGTSSPQLKFVVSNAGAQGFEVNPNSGIVSGGIDILCYNRSAAAYKPIYTNAEYHVWATSTTERARIDSSGNLGLGVTPSASSLPTIQSAYGITIGNNEAHTTKNAYYNSGWKYATTTTAARFSVGEGGSDFRFYTAASGTAGNAISFTQAMTLDASGNLGVGTTSPSYKLHVSGSAYITSKLLLDNGTAAAPSLTFFGWTNSGIYNPDGNSVAFTVNGTERGKFDSSGNLLVGTTTGTSAQLRVHTSQTSVSYMQNSAASPNGLQIYYSNATAPNNVINEFLYFNDTTTLRMSVRSNGGIANYSGNNVNLSDRREKTNFAPATSYLDKICAIPVQTFNYIDQNMEEDGGLTLGVVAQDVQAVAPELVTESNWGTEEEPKMRLSIYQTDLQYALMKCIQEQQALIQSLKARLDAANL